VTGATGPAGLSCVDFVINSQADLEAIASAGGGTTHTLTADGTYCFGAFTLTPQHSIVVPAGRRVELRGHGTNSLVQGSVDNGPIFNLQGISGSNATVHIHDFKVNNTSTVGTPRAIESSTTEAYIHDFAVLCGSGEGMRITGGRLFATQLRISNCLTGVSCRGGEVFLQNYDCESLTNGVSIDDPSHQGLQWIGGRINSYTSGIVVGASCQSIILQGVTGLSGVDFVRRTGSATINRVAIIGNTLASTTNAINWPNSLGFPQLGLTIVGNVFNVGTPFVGFTQTSQRVNSKANVGPSGLMSETPIVP